MTTVMHDLRYAVRMLGKRPGITFVVTLTLALGIGANTATFSLINAAVLRPLPYRDPDRLAVLAGTMHGQVANSGMVSYADLDAFRAQSQSFEQIESLHASSVTLTGVDDPERVMGAEVSAGFFSMLGIEPVRGRLFLPGEDRPGTDHVAVVSESFWQRRFGDDTDLSGKKLLLDGVSFTLVGVLPDTFRFPIDARTAEVWITSALDAATFPTPGAVRVKTVGRLKSGVTLEQAQADLDTIAVRLAQQYPAVNQGRGVLLMSLHERVVGDTRAASFLLLGVVGLVLLIACANVGNMLLARNEERKQEMALRAAVGASRSLLFRQLLIESALLALVGATLGTVLTAWLLDLLRTWVVGQVHWGAAVGIDLRVLGFTLALTILTSVVFGVIPALGSSRVDLHTVLRAGGRSFVKTGGSRLRGVFIVSQVAVALVLFVMAGLFARSLQKLVHVDPGFRTDNVLAFQLSIPRSGFKSAAERAELYHQVLEELAALPGVESVGATTNLPLHPAYMTTNFRIHGRPPPAPGEPRVIRYDSISPGYFPTMGVRLLRGRFFNEQDTVDHAGVMIINETMAKRYWPNEDPLGHRISLGIMNDGSPGVSEIVGIVGDQHDTRLDVGTEPYVYVPYRQQAVRFMCFVMRTSADPLGLVGAVRSAVSRVTANEAPFEFTTMDKRFLRLLEGPMAIAVLLSVFASIALGLALMGLYGTISYFVTRRTHEFGVRIALGARCADVLTAVIRQGLVFVGIGLAIGLTVSLVASCAIASMLFGVSRLDPVTFVGVPVLFLAVAVLASYVPARRAAKVDPIVALRCE